jgi:hypothetical protein
MAVSTVSTVNMYMLNKSGPYVPPIVYNQVGSNLTFPTAFNGVEVAMANLTVRNRRISVTPSTNIAYRDQPHELLVSTYQNYNNIANGMGYDMFDNASSASTYWASNTASSITNYLDGVAQTQPTQNQYSATGGYIGGGNADNFFTTVHSSGGSNGEWFQMKFPYRVGLLGVSFIGRASAESGAPREINILGSEDGISWVLLKVQTYPGYTYNTLNVATFTLLPHYPYIRIVVTKVGSYGVGIASCQLKYHAYTPAV